MDRKTSEKALISFRAWDKETSKMIYHVENAYDGLTSNIVDENGESVSYEADSFGDMLASTRYIVQRSTEIKDLSGKSLYEGDIVTIGDTRYFEIKYGSMTINNNYFVGFYLDELDSMDVQFFTEDMEKVGHIFKMGPQK